jgi:hypothetical protein
MIRTPHPRRALSYVEVVVSMAIIATSVAASLRAFGSYSIGRRAFEERAVAMELANQLMAEINQLPYEEAGSNTIGIDASESTSNRSTFDDIDDYHNWDVSPPRNRANTSLTQYDGYRQAVQVAYETTIPSPPGGTWAAGAFKRITVKVYKDGKLLATLVTVRSRNNANS